MTPYEQELINDIKEYNIQITFLYILDRIDSIEAYCKMLDHKLTILNTKFLNS
jgi:hypothetical protein